MNYKETINYLENLQHGKIRPEIESVKNVFDELGNPQNSFKSIHIAGTNGKGSTAVMIDSILRDAGYSTGLYISPHILDFTERIKINNNPIKKTEVVGYVKRLKSYFEKYNSTYFESATIICFLYFCEKNIDIAIVETGMGGRFDATNVINPVISVITDIGVEHQKFLGNTISEIASEKGGIIKKGKECIVSATQTEAVKTLKNIAKNRNSKYYQVYRHSKVKLKIMNLSGIKFDYQQKGLFLKNLFIPLTGLHQLKNARTAIFTINRLKNNGFSIKDENIINGLKNARFNGRFEKVNNNPLIIADVGHNPDCFNVIKQTIKILFPSKKIYLLFGVKNDKDYITMIKILKPICQEIVGIKLNNHNTLDPKELIGITKRIKIKYNYFDTGKDGLDFLIRKVDKDDIILSTGSHLTVSEIKSNFLQTKKIKLCS
jgi:dihydrofolate synthase/folylpolyglutamate synthase